MRYFRVHTADTAYRTGQPRGIFTAVGRLVDAGLLTEDEVKRYWENRAYFEKALPVPPFYEKEHPQGAVTWFKDTEEARQIWREMGFYRDICAKYGVALYRTDCGSLPGEVIYEDAFQIAVIRPRPAPDAVTVHLAAPPLSGAAL